MIYMKNMGKFKLSTFAIHETKDLLNPYKYNCSFLNVEVNKITVFYVGYYKTNDATAIINDILNRL